MILAKGKPHDEQSPLQLTTLNQNNDTVYWTADSLDEFKRYWWDERYKGPDENDKVLHFSINGESPINPHTFNDIILNYDFDVAPSDYDKNDWECEIDVYKERYVICAESRYDDGDVAKSDSLAEYSNWDKAVKAAIAYQTEMPTFFIVIETWETDIDDDDAFKGTTLETQY